MLYEKEEEEGEEEEEEEEKKKEEGGNKSRPRFSIRSRLGKCVKVATVLQILKC